MVTPSIWAENVLPSAVRWRRSTRRPRHSRQGRRGARLRGPARAPSPSASWA